MDWRTLPPLAALRAFSAFADTGSVQRAGDALNVTHAAISQHLRALETHLGLSLLDRSGRAMVLTPEGQQLAQALSSGFGMIAHTVEEMTGRDASRPLHITTTPSFAANWLMPRLAEFHTSNAETSLMIDPSTALVDLSPGGIDVAIRYGQGDWPGHEVELLMPTSMVVVGAPTLFKDRRVTKPQDLVDLVWLEELGRSEAKEWLQSRGVEQGFLGRRVTVPGNLMLDGVRDGQGVAVSTKLFIEADVAAGRLVILFEDPPGDSGYYIVTRPGVLRPPARQFVNWLRQAARPKSR